MKPLAPNTLLQNRYLIVHLIGKGGMGEVYLAIDQRLGSAIALKRTFYATDELLVNAFEREARTLARLRHPVLPKVSDHFIENENQYLVMEHISGDDLAKRLNATQKPFPLSWVLFWADQLLDALAYLHSHEPPIIHRDIKPQNLKLTDENNIVLLDFGLSKNSVGQTNLTSGSGSTGSVVGYTPHYAPMEQIRGTGTNPRSDIFSLSATLYQLLTNTVPYDALTRADQVLGGKPDPLQPINELNSDVPRLISEVVLKGMSISQEQRYTSAREMQKVLRESYASLQTAMTDKTFAFNGQDEQNAPEYKPLPPSQGGNKTEGFSSPALSGQPASKTDIGAQTIPYGMTAPPIPGVSASAPANAEKTEQIQDFDATIRFDSDPKTFAEQANYSAPEEVSPSPEATLPQSGIKTEVYIGNDFDANEYLPAEDPSTQAENFATENFAPEKTSPLLEFDNQNGSPFFDKTSGDSGFETGSPATENFAPTVETQFNSGGFTPSGREGDSQPGQQFATPPPPSPEVVQSPTPVPPVTPKKKSKGMVFAVVGVLFGLLVLAAGTFGLGWYLLREPSVTDATNVSTPSPEPSAEVTPSPEQANTNTEVNPSNSEVVTSDNTSSPETTTPETTTPETTTPETTTTSPEVKQDRTKTTQTQNQQKQTTVKTQTTKTTQTKTDSKPTGKQQPTTPLGRGNRIPQ